MPLTKRRKWTVSTNAYTSPTATDSSSRTTTTYDNTSHRSNTSVDRSHDSPGDADDINKPVRHLFLVRHGQYQRKRTQSDGHLTAKGQNQAWYAANFLGSQLPDNVLFDTLTHSDMIRTRETATIIYKQLKLLKKIDIDYFSIDTDFREQNWLVGFLLEGNWHALKRDYFRLSKESRRQAKTTFEIVVAHRNIIAHVIELISQIQPDKAIAFNASVTHVIVNQSGAMIDYAYEHSYIPGDLLTMWELFLPSGEMRVKESEHVHVDVQGVKGEQRQGCCIRLLISCLR